MTSKINKLLNAPTKKLAAIGSPSDNFQVTLDILGDSSESKILGELVYFQSTEDAHSIVSIGQITEVMTSNKWHEEPSFKAVIKRYGSLPHLSKDADNRIATLNVQSTFKISSDDDVRAHKLSNSPSTGTVVSSITNEALGALIQPICKDYITEILGKAYDTNVDIPFWFKHFGDGHNGAGDAYHIGVFGKTGSGKTTTAAQMLAGYAGNNKNMSFLIFDPQEQFFNDNKVIPSGKFEDLVISKGIDRNNYKKITIPTDIALPDSSSLFAELTLTSGFLSRLFGLKTPEKLQLMAEGVEDYIEGRFYNPGFSLGTIDHVTLLKDIIKRFSEQTTQSEQAEECSRYVSMVYAKGSHRKGLINKISDINDALNSGSNDFQSQIEIFKNVLDLFKSASKQSVDNMVENILTKPGYVYIVNLAPRANANFRNENFQAKLIEVILSKVISYAEDMSAAGNKANTLIVLDEAHRYVNASANDQRLKELNRKIIDSVRTVRKYGIGHMFITQTIDSIDQEVIQQMRLFAFGYGLTMGGEFSKIKQIINDDNAAKFYRSFIDPSSNGKYPFMFHGPISPLSFTGSPLFIEMN